MKIGLYFEFSNPNPSKRKNVGGKINVKQQLIDVVNYPHRNVHKMPQRK